MTGPALDAWRKELHEGKRTRLTFDTLWTAASLEAWRWTWPPIQTSPADSCGTRTT